MKILVISRPVNPPWTEGVKNLIRGVVENVTSFDFFVPVSKGFSFKRKNIFEIPIPKRDDDFFISNAQRLPQFFNLLFERDADAYVFFGKPKVFSVLFTKHLSKIKKRKTVQVITQLKDVDKKLFFADRLVVLSDYSQKRLNSEGLDAKRIYPGLDVKTLDIKRDYRKKLDLPKGFTVLYPGDLTNRNQADILIDLIKKCPGVSFIIACRDKNRIEAENKTYIREQLKGMKRVKFVGHIQDLPALIKCCDLVIYPVAKTDWKLDIPVVLLESLALGCPILVPDREPFGELLPKPAGLKLKIEEFPKYIIRFSSNPAKLKKMGSEGKKIISSRFDIKKMAKEYERLFRSI